MGGLATRAVRVAGLALVVGAFAGRVVVAQPVMETRLLAGVHFIETLTAGAKTQERLPLVVALHPQRGDAADFIALFQGLRTIARIIPPYADARTAILVGIAANQAPQRLRDHDGPRRRLCPF